MFVICLGETVHLSNTRVVQGERLAADNATWVVVKDEVVPANTKLRAGSVVEKDDTVAQVGIQGGWYAKAATPLHTDLESLFPDDVKFAKRATTLANVLRSYRFKSLEDIVANAEGKEPFTDGKGGVSITARDLLLRYLSAEEADKRVELAQKRIS